jgi:AGZA family xanthine/uracil permease-like MFS transporter
MADYDQPQGGRSLAAWLDRQFDLTANGTTVRTEFVAGVTTFLTMVYIVFVNPDILSNAGMDRGAVFVATGLAAAISTLVMALYANYPISARARDGAQRVLRFLGAHLQIRQQALALFLSGVLALSSPPPSCAE